MKLMDFLTGLFHKPDQYEDTVVYLLQGALAAPSFSTYLIQCLARSLKQELVVIDCRIQDLASIKASLSISFLGDSMLYWIKHAQELSPPHQQALYAYISAYEGPHRLIYALDELAPKKTGNTVLTIMFDPKVTPELYVQLYHLMTDTPLTDQDFHRRLFSSGITVGLDTACLLIDYHRVLGRRHEQFFDSWLERLASPDTSLFLLSQYFFARDMRNFLITWAQVATAYPDEFWLVYWSEQLWQAAIFLEAAKRESILTAKKLVNRLPFSFINKDFRQHSIGELAQAHTFLYDADFRLKHGTLIGGLELFCAKFLLGDFKNA